MVDYQNLMETVKKGFNTLIELAIDTEQMEDSQMIELFNQLNKNKLESLLLHFCEYFTDEVFSQLNAFKYLKELKFYKANEVTREGYINCFNNFASTSLLHLNLEECNELDDEGLITILSKSKELQCLQLSWQKYITSHSIKYLFQNCLQLQKCILVGIKSLDASGFPEICELQPYFEGNKYNDLKKVNQYKDDYNNDCINNDGYLSINIQDFFTKKIDFQQIKLYQKLRSIDCTKSDMVPDELLQILHLFKPYLIALNYYGENM